MRLFHMVALSLLATSSAFADDCKPGFFSMDLCVEAEKARQEITLILPQVMTPSMTWKSVAAAGPRLIGSIVWEMPVATLDERLKAANKTRPDLADELVEFTKTILCGQKLFYDFIEAGGVFQFDYKSQDDVTVASIPVSDC
tara:strand:+ start:1569 stop:1994 length:426 start_codon:yes stop_codon:yes gene_type:complete